MHPVSGALPVPYVPAHVSRGALVAQRPSFAPPRYRICQSCRTFVALSVSLLNDLGDPPTVLSFSFFHWLVVWGCGL